MIVFSQWGDSLFVAIQLVVTCAQADGLGHGNVGVFDGHVVHTCAARVGSTITFDGDGGGTALRLGEAAREDQRKQEQDARETETLHGGTSYK